MVLPVTLAVLVEPDQLQVVVENPSPAAVRIWSRECSWGHATYSIIVARAAQPDDERELTVKPVRWTVNVPQVIELESGDRTAFGLIADGFAWQGGASLEPWRGESWQVRVRLRIPDTPEARDHGVLVGETVSALAISFPPHAWFFDRLPHPPGD